MSEKREIRKAELQQRLAVAAEAQIAENGLGNLKAREVTGMAGCALGALYNAFDDLDSLVLHVNTRTLARLGEILPAACSEASGAPEARLQALATAYAKFALAEPNLWDALFNHRIAADAIPDGYREKHFVLIELILPPLRELRPDLSADDLGLRARTSFAAIHGVVQLSLQARFMGVPPEKLIAEVQALALSMTSGPHRV